MQVPRLYHHSVSLKNMDVKYTRTSKKKKNLDLDFVNLSGEEIGVFEGKYSKTQSPKGN